MSIKATATQVAESRLGKSIVVLALCAVLACMGLAGCSSTSSNSSSSQKSSGAAASESSYTFTDDLGNQVTVDNPQRVVACMGSFANIWQLASGTLVGASNDAFTYTDYGIDASSVAEVGDFSNLSLESIIDLNPDFVIMTGSTTGRGSGVSQQDFKDSLESSGIPVAYFTVTTFDDYLRMLRTCCDITGDEQAYQKNGQAVSDQIDKIVASVPKDKSASVMLLTTYSRGTTVQNSSTMTGDMLKDLGAVNLADQNPSLLSDFSLESIIEANPDYILLIPMGNDAAAATRNLQEATDANPAWSTLSAVQNGHYITLDPNLFQYKPCNRWAESYQTLYNILYA